MEKSQRPLEELVKDIKNIIEEIKSPEEKEKAKELISLMVDVASLSTEQLKEYKQNILELDSVSESLKNFFIKMIDERLEFLEQENMIPAQRKAHKFMQLANTENEQERETLRDKLDNKGKYELTINNGPFGILYYGRNENGELGIGLKLSNRTSSDQVVYIHEEELEDIFTKNNMEILSMFNEESQNRRFSEMDFRALYLIDSLREKGIVFESESYEPTKPYSVIKIKLENGQTLEVQSDCIDLGGDLFMSEGDTPITIFENEDPQMHAIFEEAMERYPEVIEQVKAGTYHSRLSKKERELSALEAEAIRDTAELKEFESKEGQNIGEE